MTDMGIAIETIEKLLKEAQEAEEMVRAECGTCRHWGVPIVGETHGVCWAIEATDVRGAAATSPYISADGYSAQLRPPHTFCCSLWEKKT